MRITAALALFLIAMPLAAFNRGDVYFEHRSFFPIDNTNSYESWQFDPAWSYAIGADAWPLIYKEVPLFGPGHFVIPASNQILFHRDRTVSVWDGVYRVFTEPGKGYTEIFRDDAELGEIAPMRSGHFLVPEGSMAGAKLIEFTLNGRVREIAFPNGIGAEHIELLGDQCTLLYGVANRVARMNICTGAALSDFATLSAPAGAIRQLPSRDVVVADGSAVLQFTADGALLRSYPFAGVTHVALTPDGSAFWAAAVVAGKAELRRYDGGTRDVPIGNPGMSDGFVPTAVDDLVVVGEWRAAALPKPRSRAAR